MTKKNDYNKDIYADDDICSDYNDNKDDDDDDNYDSNYDDDDICMMNMTMITIIVM